MLKKMETEINMHQISLRTARITSGYTVEEAAKWINISPETLSEYERDAGEIPLSTAIEILSLYRVPVDIVYFGNESELIRSKNRY